MFSSFPLNNAFALLTLRFCSALISSYLDCFVNIFYHITKNKTS